MNKKQKQTRNIVVGIFLIIGIIFFGNQLGFLSFVGISGLNYVTPFQVEDGQVGVFQSEAYLDLFENSNEVSFNVGYHFSSDDRKARDSILNTNVKYEIFNYFSNKWEVIEDSSWRINVPVDIRATSSSVNTPGTGVYGDGIPGKFAYVKTSSSSWTRYYSCLDGMTVEQAKILNPLPEGTSSYTYKCAYGGDRVLDEDYDNTRGDSDYDYFPKLITVRENYIKDDKLRFRVTFTTLSSGVNSLTQNNFNINVWDVKTEIITHYRFGNNDCTPIELSTFEVTENDYKDLISCQENIILDKWGLPECTLQKVKFTEVNESVFDTEEECISSIPSFNYLYIIGILALIVILSLIYIKFMRR